jgi:hypothetical protein
MMMPDAQSFDPGCTAQELGYHLYLEQLRATVRHTMQEREWCVERTASEIGVSEHKLRELLDGRCYILSEDLAPFEAWCEGIAVAPVYPEQVALSLLFQDFGPRLRAQARQRFVGRLRTVYTRLKMPVPTWIHRELRNWQELRPRSFIRRRRRT